jgi:hypothetical protein
VVRDLDWKVCTFDGEMEYGSELVPGGARFGVGGGTPEFTKGTTWCLDVLGALKLLPDGTVFFAGENREALIRPADLSTVRRRQRRRAEPGEASSPSAVSVHDNSREGGRR